MGKGGGRARTRRCARWSSILLPALVGCLPNPAVRAPAIVIRNVSVLPMTDTGTLAAYTVIVRGTRIAALGPNDDIDIPAGAELIDGTGKFLIPGLIEMHAHMSKTRASGFGLYVVHGVTTIRDLGSEHAEVVRWRREIREGARTGPRMLLAGPYLESLRNIERMRRDPPESRVEPFERARIAVKDPADARRIIDSLAALEVDHFKVRTVQNRETYVALVAAAHAAGKRLVGHAPLPSPSAFIDAGQDGLEHGFFVSPDSLPDERRPHLWRALAARDVGVVPTLVVTPESVLRPLEYYRALVTDTGRAVHPLRAHVSRFMLLDWREQVEELTPQRADFFRRFWPSLLQQVREMHAAGVRIMAGSDVAVLNIFPGLSLHDELRLFVDSVGMTPAEALASATRVPAEWLGLIDSVGTVAEGKIADLVLLDANPLENISNTRHINSVVLRGRLFERRDLEALLADVAEMPDIHTNDWLR